MAERWRAHRASRARKQVGKTLRVALHSTYTFTHCSAHALFLHCILMCVVALQAFTFAAVQW